MALIFKSTSDGFEVQVKVVWQLVRQFISNLILTIWIVISLLSALQASGIDPVAWLQGLGR